jgi:hypothetical protein
MGVDHVRVDGSLIGGWVGGAVEEGGFEQGMRLRRQAVSASSWVSWVSVAVAGWYSSKNWRHWCW